IGFYTTFLGAIAGVIVGRFYDGTVIPVAIGYAVLGIAVVLVVLATERGRLFRPGHVEPVR
ncbi:hypothetical protein ABTF37_19735, partial [Acinetobacter baumannii]